MPTPRRTSGARRPAGARARPRAVGAPTIETYTVLYDRDGAPLRGPVIGRLDDGRRFLAGTPDDRGVREGLVPREGVGGHATTVDGLGRFDPR